MEQKAFAAPENEMSNINLGSSKIQFVRRSSTWNDVISKQHIDFFQKLLHGVCFLISHSNEGDVDAKDSRYYKLLESSFLIVLLQKEQIFG